MLIFRRKERVIFPLFIEFNYYLTMFLDSNILSFSVSNCSILKEVNDIVIDLAREIVPQAQFTSTIDSCGISLEGIGIIIRLL